MAEVKWIKLYIDMFDKQKIKKIRRLPAGNNILLIWIMFLSLAGKCNAGGMIYITESVQFTEEDLADELGFDINTIRLALQAFENFDMISTVDGFISLVGWNEHQSEDRLAEIKEQNRLRKQRQREQKRLLANMSRDSHGTVTGCHAIEEEKEEDKEEESHSVIHSAPTGEEKEALMMRYMGGKLGKGVVMLSDEQMSDLLDRLSVEEFDKYVGIVADMELSGKHYRKKTHYQAILDMAAKDRRVRKE